MRKGQGLPINLIVLIVIALVVIVVLLFIFRDRASGFNETMDACKLAGGECKVSCLSSEDAIAAHCPDAQVCCVGSLTRGGGGE